MLPYTPLHHILLREVRIPLVATSGNLSDEPICIKETEAFSRLNEIADLFLIHDRPILRHVDDSVARVMVGRELVLRRARGYAPLPIAIGRSGASALAVGPHQKNTVAFQVGSNVFLSQHLGDLETEQSLKAFQDSIGSLQTLYEIEPKRVICDLHPDYLSTKYAKDLGIPCVEIQHHHAHIASCMAENQLTGVVLGVAWDGTGAGADGTIWGGEFLLGDESRMERIATFRKFRLPGASQAVKEPRRSAIGLLFETFDRNLTRCDNLPPLQSFNENERLLLSRMLAAGFNSPYTSSAGRLFDAVSSLIGLRQVASFEGQGAMELEFSLAGIQSDECYTFEPGSEINWIPMIKEIVYDCSRHISVGTIAVKFHNTLVEMIIAVVKSAGCSRVVLSGGCFQNRYLTERTITRLQKEGFKPYWHQRVPPNDGGIALGQMYAGNTQG
jgi:hydrogenase maturation protein HypF